MQALCAQLLSQLRDNERPYEGNSGHREREVRHSTPKTGVREEPQGPVLDLERKANSKPSPCPKKVVPVLTNHPPSHRKRWSRQAPRERVTRENMVKEYSPGTSQTQEDSKQVVHTPVTSSRTETMETRRTVLTSDSSHIQAASPPTADPIPQRKVSVDKSNPTQDSVRENNHSTLSLQDMQHIVETSEAHNSVDSSVGTTTTPSSHAHNPQSSHEVSSAAHTRNKSRSPSPTPSTTSTSSSFKQSARVPPLAREPNPTSHTSGTRQTNPNTASKQEVVTYIDIPLPPELSGLRKHCSEDGLAVKSGYTDLAVVLTVQSSTEHKYNFKLPNSLGLVCSQALYEWETYGDNLKLDLELTFKRI